MHRGKLRVAYVYRDFVRRGSIPGRYVRLAERLAREEDVEVTAVCSEATREPTGAPIQFETVEPIARGRGRFSYAAECSSFASRSTRKLAGLRDRFDVVHVEGYASQDADLVTVHEVRRAEFDRYFDRYASASRLRPAVSPYVLRPQDGVVMSIERRLYSPPVPFCLSVSKGVANDLQRVHGVPAELIEVIPYAVDVEAFRRLPAVRARIRAAQGVEDDRLVLLFVGDDFERKGLDAAIEGLARSNTDALLWVVGGGNSGSYAAQASQLGVADRVKFLGQIPNDELPSWYSAADVFVLTSRDDVWGIPVVEAMAAGCVVVTSEFTGAHEIVERGVDGHVLEGAGSAEELAHLLGGQLQDREYRAEVAERAVVTAAPFAAEPLYARWRAAHDRARELRLERRAA